MKNLIKKAILVGMVFAGAVYVIGGIILACYSQSL